MALLVDRVVDVLPAGLALRWVEPGLSLNRLVAGAVEVDGVDVHLLDPARLLLAEEAARLSALSEQARARLAAWGLGGGEAAPPAGEAGRQA